MEKMKSLVKNKVFLIAISVVIVAIIGSVIGLTMGKSSVKINPEKLNGLIKAEYNTSITSETDKKLGLNVTGNLSDKDKDSLIKELFNAGKNWNKETVEVNFFNSKEEVKPVDKFYVEGLQNQTILDYKTNVAKVGSFETLPKIDKAKTLSDYNKGNVSYKDGNLTIGLDMAVKDETIDVVSQAKAFIIMFRDVNKDKDISNVLLEINHNSKEKGYSYSTEYENILKNIKMITF